jgi:serine/threonine protein kinase
MIDDYDFLCGNDFTFVKLALGNDDYHTIRVQAELAITIDFSGGLRQLEEIIIDRCTKFTQIKWPENAQNIKRLKIGNCSRLENLDLSGLVNLEELAIVNCKQLTKIKGLGEQVKQINIQGCKLDNLDLTRCKKIQDFILTTHQSNLNLNFKHNPSLYSVIINLDLTNHQKIENFYRDCSEKVDCKFNECTNLNHLTINSPNAPASIDVTGCISLKTALFLLEERTQITGLPTCTQLDDALDFENKMIEVNNYTIKNKKNALKMPENPADVETIIQQNGVLRKKNKSCLVKLQLLMRPREHSYIPTHNKYTINKYKGSLADTNSSYSKSEYKSEAVVLEQDNKWWSETDLNSIKQYNQLHYQLNFWNDYLFNNEKSLYKHIDKLKPHVPQKPQKHLNSNPIFLANASFTDLDYDFKSNKINQNLPLRAMNLIKGRLINNVVYPVIVAKKPWPTPRFLLNDSKLKAYKKAYKNKKKSAKKRQFPSNDLYGIEHVSEKIPLAAVPEGYESKTYNLSDYEITEKLVSPRDLLGVKKEAAVTRQLIPEPVLADYETEEVFLSNLDIKEQFNSQDTLTPAEKTKADAQQITANPVLAGYETEASFLSNLDIKEQFNSQDTLTPAEKTKADALQITANPVLAGYETEASFLSNLDIEEQFNSQDMLTPAEKTKADAQQITANPVLAGYETEASFLSNLDIEEQFDSQDTLTPAEKTKADAQQITANPVLAGYETEASFLSDLDIKEQLSSQRTLTPAEKTNADAQCLAADLALTEYECDAASLMAVGIKENTAVQDDLLEVKKVKVEAEYLIAHTIDDKCNSKAPHNDDFDFSYHVVRALVDLKPRDLDLYSDDSFFLTLFNERLGKNIQEILSNSHPQNATDSEQNYTPHIARALVDLKPRNSDFFSDDFNSFYLTEFNERINKYIKEIQHDLNVLGNLTSVGKVKIENQYLSADPILAPYEYEQSFLTVININTGIASQAEHESENEEFIMDYPVDGAEFDALRELLIECDLLDEVLNDESGILLEYMSERTKNLETGQRNLDIDFDSSGEVIYPNNAMDVELEEGFEEEYGPEFWNTTELDDLDPLEEELQFSELVISDEMSELLNTMTDEEMELLFPQGVKNTNRAYLDVLQGIANKPSLEINLKNISPEHVKKVLEFFNSQEQSGIQAWEKGISYAFEDGTEFFFKNDVFQRARKAGHDGVRYEAISNKKLLGEGGFGTVRRIKGTVSLDVAEEAIHFKKHGTGGKRRVVKVQHHSEETNPLSHYQNGFTFAKRAVHLAIKEPTVIDNYWNSQTSYTVMNEIAGRELFDIRADDYEGIDVLSTEERIDLTKALLLALKEQVTEQGLVHRDIKPENIMVDLGPPIGVKIIDYDMSMETPDGQSVGTEGYYAPELVTDPMSTSAKSDVYSMARVIALIWRVDLATYIENENLPYTPHLFCPEDTLFDIFNGINDLSEDEKRCIERTLTGMLETDPNQRFSIDEAIESFVILGTAEETSYWGESVECDIDAIGFINAHQTNEKGAEFDVGSLEPCATEFDDIEPLDEELQSSDHFMSDDMNELLNLMTDEEIELLFPNGIKNTNRAYLNTLQGIVNKPDLEYIAIKEHLPLELFNGKQINEIALEQLFTEKKSRGYSSASFFFQTKTEEYDLIHQTLIKVPA